MRLIQMLIIFFILIVLGCSPKPRFIDHNDLRNQASVIINERCGGAIATERSVLTADHCIHSGSTTFQRCDNLNKRYPATVLKVDMWSDLVELKTDESFSRISYIRRPFLNENVTLIHHRCKGGWCHETGSVVRMSVSNREAAMDCDDCDSRVTGMSGSGIWGEDQALVGIVTSVGFHTGFIYFTILM